MNVRWFLSLFTAASLAVAQTPPRPLQIPDSQLESAHQANPDDPQITGRLLSYYGKEDRDPTWSARFALLSWAVQHQPEAPYFGIVANTGMPKALRDQLKPLWITQVHQHPDNPRVLRNAAAALEDVPPSIRVGGNVQQANLLRQVKPEYPPLAREAGIQGTVRFVATIGPEGEIQTLQLESGHPLLVQSAMLAVKQWRYKPTLLNGNPVSVITTIDVNFTLQGSPQGQAGN